MHWLFIYILHKVIEIIPNEREEEEKNTVRKSRRKWEWRENKTFAIQIDALNHIPTQSILMNATSNLCSLLQ